MLALRTHLYTPVVSTLYQPDVPLLDEEYMNVESAEEIMDFMMHEVDHSSVMYVD